MGRIYLCKARQRIVVNTSKFKNDGFVDGSSFEIKRIEHKTIDVN
jgi:hypothetical protein